MRIFQRATLSDDPTFPMDAVTKQYVDNLVIQAGVASGGGVFFIDITPTSTGIVGNKAYVANTVPINRVITDGTVDTSNVRVWFIAEGSGSFYSPAITITTSPALPGTPILGIITEDAADKRFFTGYVDLTNVSSGDYTITATSSTGSSATTVIHRAVAGPAVSSVTIGALPGSQTEVKSSDIVAVSGAVPNAATYVEIVAGAAAGSLSSQVLSANDSAGAGYKNFSGTFTVSSGTGAQNIQARARNALGTFGTNTTSGNTITLNQTYPTIGARTITYPASQSGLKGSETATINSTIINYDTVVYSTSADLSVTSPNAYAATKTVTRVGGGYVIGTNNYTITANKASNNATAVASAQVTIANTAPTAAISIVGSPARLQSTSAGNDYTIQLTPSQTLGSTPTLVASSGTWQGIWTNNFGIWSRVLRISDPNPKGAQTFNTLQVTGLAGVVGTSITAGASYTVGGFPTRTITFPAFARFTLIGTTVTDITKVTASYTGATTLARQTNTADVFQGFTIVSSDGTYNPTGGYLFISDAAFAGSNTTGTLQLDVTESA